MSEQKHTPEPWRVNEDASGDIFVSGADSTWIAEIGAPDEDGGRDDAARIVACVNACAGMNDPAAELEQLRAENAELKKAQGEPYAMDVIAPDGHATLMRYSAVTDGCFSQLNHKVVRLYTAPQPAAAIDDDNTIRERDNYHEWADKLANAIAEFTGVDIGEHSNLNCPWHNALEALEELNAQPAPTVPEGWRSLTDAEWMNIVNHDRAFYGYGKDEAVATAVKMTEAKLKELNAAPEQPKRQDHRLSNLEYGGGQVE